MQNHTAPRGQMTARAGGGGSRVEQHGDGPDQAASSVYYTFDDDAAGVRPVPLSEVAGPEERFQRHTVEQIVGFVPMVQILDAPVPQMGASIPAVLEQVIVLPLSRSSGRAPGRSGPCSVGGRVGVGSLAGRTS